MSLFTLVAHSTVRNKLSRAATCGFSSGYVVHVSGVSGASSVISFVVRGYVAIASVMTRDERGDICSRPVEGYLRCVRARLRRELSITALSGRYKLSRSCLSCLFGGGVKVGLSGCVGTRGLRTSGRVLGRGCSMSSVTCCLNFYSRDCFVSYFGGRFNGAPGRFEGGVAS